MLLTQDESDFLATCNRSVRDYAAKALRGRNLAIRRVGQAWEVQGRGVNLLLASPAGIGLADLRPDVATGDA